MEWLNSTFGETAGPVVSLVLWALAALFVLWLVMRLFRSPASRFAHAGQAGQHRLEVVDATAVDNRRRLVLVRCDNKEHLVLIGGMNDLVIDQDINGQQPEPADLVRPETEPRRASLSEIAAPAVAAPLATAAAAPDAEPPVPAVEKPDLAPQPPEPEPEVEPEPEPEILKAVKTEPEEPGHAPVVMETASAEEEPTPAPLGEIAEPAPASAIDPESEFIAQIEPEEAARPPEEPASVFAPPAQSTWTREPQAKPFAGLVADRRDAPRHAGQAAPTPVISQKPADNPSLEKEIEEEMDKLIKELARDP